MKTIWNQNALDILRAETNIFCLESDRIIFTYDMHEYAPHRYIHNNDELLSVVREIVAERYEMDEEMECLDLFPAEYLPFLS